jgi:hypothetical protein
MTDNVSHFGFLLFLLAVIDKYCRCVTQQKDNLFFFCFFMNPRGRLNEI